MTWHLVHIPVSSKSSQDPNPTAEKAGKERRAGEHSGSIHHTLKLDQPPRGPRPAPNFRELDSSDEEGRTGKWEVLRHLGMTVHMAPDHTVEKSTYKLNCDSMIGHCVGKQRQRGGGGVVGDRGKEEEKQQGHLMKLECWCNHFLPEMWPNWSLLTGNKT